MIKEGNYIKGGINNPPSSDRPESPRGQGGPVEADKVEIELHRISKIQKNIDALERAIEGTPRASDWVSMIDTQSILLAIQDKITSQKEGNMKRTRIRFLPIKEVVI